MIGTSTTRSFIYLYLSHGGELTPWLHRLELASRRPADDESPPARLIDGARRGPLEDSGGFPGYEEIVDVLADASHPDHAQHSAWVADMIGSDAPFDPAFLDVPAVNRTLAEQFRRTQAERKRPK